MDNLSYANNYIPAWYHKYQHRLIQIRPNQGYTLRYREGTPSCPHPLCCVPPAPPPH